MSALLCLLLLLAGCTGRPNPFRWTGTRATPTTVRISWAHPLTNVTFNVYSAPRPALAAMTLRTNTAARAVEFPANKTNEFFAVRAVRGQQLSPWGTQ